MKNQPRATIAETRTVTEDTTSADQAEAWVGVTNVTQLYAQDACVLAIPKKVAKADVAARYNFLI